MVQLWNLIHAAPRQTGGACQNLDERWRKAINIPKRWLILFVLVRFPIEQNTNNRVPRPQFNNYVTYPYPKLRFLIITYIKPLSYTLIIAKDTIRRVNTIQAPICSHSCKICLLTIHRESLISRNITDETKRLIETSTQCVNWKSKKTGRKRK